MLNKGAQSLPQKDAQAFKHLAKLYDAKNYKKGLKHANELLEKYPQHAETLSLKALFQLGLGQENKALQTAKVGLMKSKMKSMFCWHTMGSIYKVKRDYLQSSKCFQNAYRFQPDNIALLRQIAAMQASIRDYSAHVQTRLSILKLKPNMIQNWTGFTLANHLKGDFQETFKALKSLDTLILTADLKPVELSHFFIYRAIACKDAEKYEQMYQTLQKNKDKIKDQVMWFELCLESSLKLSKLDQGKKYLDFLIKKFPENIDYMIKFKAVHQITSDKELYQQINKQFGSKIAKILYISVLENEEQFKTQFSILIKPYYKKNLVSLFAEIQIIYESSSVKREWIESVLQSFSKSLESKGQYPDGQQSLSPSEYLWSIYILAQHYGMQFQTLQQAYELIKAAITFTNTVSQFYLIKAQLQYKMHNNIESLQTINEARKTDLADRYMNNICVKYLFKCQKNNTAQDVMRLFMRDQANSYELQNHWYIIQAGVSFLKQRNFDAGLRHMNFVNKQFGDMLANQFDFHYYCLRKWTLREYTQLITFNDNIYSDKKYMEAAGHAIKYLREYAHFIKSQEQAKIKFQQNNHQQKAGKKKNKKKKKQVEVQELSPIQAFRKKIDYYGKQYRQNVGNKSMDEAFVWSKNVVSAKFVNKKNLKENKLYGKANNEAILVFIHFNKPLLVLKSFKKLLKTKYDECQIALTTLRVLAYFERYLSSQDVHQISKEVINEFLSQNFAKVTSKSYHEEINSYWKSQNYILSPIRIKVSQLIVKNEENRQNLISLFKEEFNLLIHEKDTNVRNTEKLFYVVHNLEFYGQFTAELKAQAKQVYGKKISYFTNWVQAIDKLPDSTWTMWWLSEYDIHREQLDNLDKESANSKTTESK